MTKLERATLAKFAQKLGYTRRDSHTERICKNGCRFVGSGNQILHLPSVDDKVRYYSGQGRFTQFATYEDAITFLTIAALTGKCSTVLHS